MVEYAAVDVGMGTCIYSPNFPPGGECPRPFVCGQASVCDCQFFYCLLKEGGCCPVLSIGLEAMQISVMSDLAACADQWQHSYTSELCGHLGCVCISFLSWNVYVCEFFNSVSGFTPGGLHGRFSCIECRVGTQHN